MNVVLRYGMQQCCTSITSGSCVCMKVVEHADILRHSTRKLLARYSTPFVLSPSQHRIYLGLFVLFVFRIACTGDKSEKLKWTNTISMGPDDGQKYNILYNIYTYYIKMRLYNIITEYFSGHDSSMLSERTHMSSICLKITSENRELPSCVSRMNKNCWPNQRQSERSRQKLKHPN